MTGKEQADTFRTLQKLLTQVVEKFDFSSSLSVLKSGENNIGASKMLIGFLVL